MDGIMEIVSYDAFDLKWLSSRDISYNPALGSGQLQVRDIRYVTLVEKTTWDFCKIIDEKFIKSHNGFEKWLKLAIDNGWIKTDE